MASKKVLLTGFEPFNGGSFNPSGAVVEAIGNDGVDGVEIVTAILPVEFKRSAAMLVDLISSHKPDVVISLGQAEGRDFIGPEQVAINLADARIADNAGVKMENQLLNETAADGYFSTLPIRSIVEAISSLGISAKISYSAGAFICNEIFFTAQSALQGSKVISGFIHLPLAPNQAAEFPGLPTMAIEDQVRAIQAAIKVSINV
ncbi:MAG: pyroglutamyl-peptidase I [Candidatus Planktophila sp.]|jgi:pyroglutamyl-peptidase